MLSALFILSLQQVTHSLVTAALLFDFSVVDRDQGKQLVAEFDDFLGVIDSQGQQGAFGSAEFGEEVIDAHIACSLFQAFLELLQIGLFFFCAHGETASADFLQKQAADGQAPQQGAHPLFVVFLGGLGTFRIRYRRFFD